MDTVLLGRSLSLVYLRAQVFWRILNNEHTIPTYKCLVIYKNLVSGSGDELKLEGFSKCRYRLLEIAVLLIHSSDLTDANYEASVDS